LEIDPREILNVHSKASSNLLLTGLLRDVSRSFYLTLRVLPKSIRNEIGLAYLLARATDTIADTEAIAVPERLTALRELRQAILSPHLMKIDLPALQSSQTNPGERILLERINDALALLFSFSPSDRELIQTVLQTITEGQEMDLLRFGHAAPPNVVALQSDAELDDYTFRVAGCVGEFWTRICFAHLSPAPRQNLNSLVPRAIRFGQGLQLVNILRDLPADLAKGRCYLPEPALRQHNLRPVDLLDPGVEQRLRPLYDQWLQKANDHLLSGWSYVLDLPFSWMRVRLACAWPVLIGLQTCEKLSRGPILDPAQRIKVSRPEIKKIMAKSITTYLFPGIWARLPRGLSQP
jgi:farnesyl-diphosphate farnesyltransferase